jgi:hypothetical protein
MNDGQPRPIVNGKRKFVLGGIALITLAVLMITGGFVEGLISGCMTAVASILGINLLAMAYRSPAPRA